MTAATIQSSHVQCANHPASAGGVGTLGAGGELVVVVLTVAAPAAPAAAAPPATTTSLTVTADPPSPNWMEWSSAIMRLRSGMHPTCGSQKVELHS